MNPDLTRVARRGRRLLRRLLRRLTGVPAGPAPRPVVGTVERFSRRVIQGWVAVPAGAPAVRVSLQARKVELTSTWAVPGAGRSGPGEIRQFRFIVDELWDYLARADRVSVVVAGQALPIAERGMSARPPGDGLKTLTDLQERLAAGHVFSKYGRLQLDKNRDLNWQRAALGAYETVVTILRDGHGLEAFANYGAVLGAVRDGRFIGHDNDIDLSYISRFSQGPQVAAELKGVALDLIERGWRVTCTKTHLVARARDDAWRRVDVFPVYFNDAGVMCFPFGVTGTATVRREDWRGTREVALGIGKIAIPANPEPLLAALYGPHWRQPNPGFSWTRDRLPRAEDADVPLADREQVYWESAHATDPDDEPSPFGRWVGARPDLPAVVVDLGCGGGRDSVAFAGGDRTVLGLDRSRHAVRRARERAQAEGVGARVSFAECDLADGDALRSLLGGAVRDAGGAGVLFYARFVFQAVPAEVQEGVLAAVAAVARVGDQFATEFRTTADEKLPKASQDHYRRFQDGPAFAAVLQERYGFEVLATEEGSGLAPYRAALPPYKAEDPALYRVIARFR